MTLMSEERVIFRRSVRTFLEKEAAPLVATAEETRTFPVSLLRRMGELGYLCMRYGTDVGGAGADHVMECMLHEELARVCASFSAAALAHTAGSNAIYHFGARAQREKYVVPAVKGEKIGAFSITEPNAGSDVRGIQTTAKLDGDHYVLNGTKVFVSNGPIADFVTVAAYTDRSKGVRGISIFVVERGTPGFDQTQRMRKMGFHAAETGIISIADCRVPAENLIGEAEGGFERLMSVLDRNRIIVAARHLGIAALAYETAAQYARERAAFGRKISEFQAVKFKLAEMATDLAAAELLVYRAAQMLDRDEPCRKEISMAKLFATEMSVRVSTDAVQILGGCGYTPDFPAERCLRDAQLGPIYDGTSNIQKVIIARELGF